MSTHEDIELTPAERDALDLCPKCFYRAYQHTATTRGIDSAVCERSVLGVRAAAAGKIIGQRMVAAYRDAGATS